MSEFTQKYALIQLFEPLPEGSEFSSSDWPLHSTIADVFATDWDVLTMTRHLAELLGNREPASSNVLEDKFFGPQREVRVALLGKTASLLSLHHDVIACLETGGWKPNDPQFAKDGFLPHSTVQKHARLHEGETATFDALSIVDFFPENDPYQRKILKTIPIGKRAL